MEGFITTVNGYAWGPAMLVLLLGTGIFLTLGLGFLSLRRLPLAFKLLFTGFSSHGAGDIPPVQGVNDLPLSHDWNRQYCRGRDGDHAWWPGRTLLDVDYGTVRVGYKVRGRRARGALPGSGMSWGGTVVVRCTISVTASAKGGPGSPRHLLFSAAWQASV